MDTLPPGKPLVDQVYEMILEAICAGVLTPGERITQEDLAARLGVSRQPVSHALALLKAQGFVKPRARQGLVVAQIDEGFLRDIYQLRAAIEPLAVQLASGRMTAQAAREGQAIIDNGIAALAAGDKRAAREADIEFHRFVYELSGNRLIPEVMGNFWSRLHLTMSQVLRPVGMSQSVWQDHAAILQHMIDGNARLAAEAMRNHLTEALDRVQSEANLDLQPGQGDKETQGASNAEGG